MTSVISLNGICFDYPNGVRVFDNLDLNIQPGTRTVITGPDGAGKSTLLRIMAGLEIPRSGIVRREFGPLETALLGGDPQDDLIGLTVEDEIVFGLENMGLSRKEMEIRLTAALDAVGLPGMEGRMVHTLSGGEQQKLALASRIAMGCRLWLLDEVFGMWDHPSRSRFRSFMNDLRARERITVVEIPSESSGFFEADRIIHLSEGEPILDCTCEEYMYAAPGDFGFGRVNSLWAYECGLKRK